jgi:hypothetical protein
VLAETIPLEVLREAIRELEESPEEAVAMAGQLAEEGTHTTEVSSRRLRAYPARL